MRALLATTGLLVLAGSALAGRPAAHTLRKSPNGPITAVAQDGNLAAWFTFTSGRGGCNEVHILSPGMRDRLLPGPSPDTMTCNWNLADGRTQLAIAARLSTALWTLHETGASSFDQVVAASFNGPERQLKRFSHATNGTGDWLGGVAGAGRTLAYSWYDIEYVDPTECLSSGRCKQKIADGGIQVVTRTTDTRLPGALPALQLAASGNRIAYIPATKASSGRASASHNATVYVVDAATGAVAGAVSVHGEPAAVALTPHVLAVLLDQGGPHDRITWYTPTGSRQLGSVLVSPNTAPQLAVDDQLIVYRVFGKLNGIPLHGGRIRRLAKTSADDTVGLSLANGRLLWAVNHGPTGRLRALSVG
ncbi:MAG TPA: hypothetical protein VE984_10390 [Gaiellaceae bacterium]|nr:hypothetical protein [Gaiellaceae bacterium]